MRKIIERFVEYPVYANMIIVVVILAGGLSLSNMKKSFFPETESRFLSVSVFYPGASPVEMEEGVTSRIEEAIRGLMPPFATTSLPIECRHICREFSIWNPSPRVCTSSTVWIGATNSSSSMPPIAFAPGG